MKARDIAQLGFSTIFFDTLFGLVLFYGIDSFLEIHSVAHFLLYFSVSIILMHWWLLFKACDDTFGQDVNDSAVDLFVGVIEIILIQYIVLLSKSFEYESATFYLIILFLVDLTWAVVWEFVGRWSSKSHDRIQNMEGELKTTLLVDGVGIISFTILYLSANLLSPMLYVCIFVVLYALYIYLTFRNKLIDVRSF